MPHCPLTYSSAAARTRTPGGGNVSRAKKKLPPSSLHKFHPICTTVRNLFCPFQPHEKWLGRAVFT